MDATTALNSISFTIISATAVLHEIKTELQIMNCATEEEKDELRTKFKENKKNTIIASVAIGVISFMIPVIIESVKKGR